MGIQLKNILHRTISSKLMRYEDRGSLLFIILQVQQRNYTVMHESGNSCSLMIKHNQNV